MANAFNMHKACNAWNFEDPAFAGAAYVTELNRGHEGQEQGLPPFTHHHDAKILYRDVRII